MCAQFKANCCLRNTFLLHKFPNDFKHMCARSLSFKSHALISFVFKICMWQSSHVTANNFNALLTSFCNGINIIFRSFFHLFFLLFRDFHLLLKLSVINTQSQCGREHGAGQDRGQDRRQSTGQCPELKLRLPSGCHISSGCTHTHTNTHSAKHTHTSMKQMSAVTYAAD